MNTNNKNYYITISESNNPPQKTWFENHQYIINFFFSLATLILSITTSILSISIASQSNRLQVQENMPLFYYEQIVYDSTAQYNFSTINIINSRGIITNGLCEIYDIITINSKNKSYNFILSGNYKATQNKNYLYSNYDNNTKTFSLCQTKYGIPLDYIETYFNDYFSANTLPFTCSTNTYVRILYNDFQDKHHEEFYQLKHREMYSIPQDMFEKIYLYKDLCYLDNRLELEKHIENLLISCE